MLYIYRPLVTALSWNLHFPVLVMETLFLLLDFFFLHLIHFKATTQKMIRSNQKVQGITCELKHVHTSSKIIIFTNIRTLVKRNCLQITFSSLR